MNALKRGSSSARLNGQLQSNRPVDGGILRVEDEAEACLAVEQRDCTRPQCFT